MNLASTIKFTQLELELSSKCNAACPQCPREIPFIKSVLNQVSKEISLDCIKRWFNKDFLSDLQIVQFKGAYSEPVIAQDFFPIVEYFCANTTAKIVINTNGSLRKPELWNKLGNLLCNRGEVVFGIDGLEDTHALYRVNTNFNKLIENARAYIAGGGNATWQFIKFAHNIHQVETAQQMATELGFNTFKLIDNVRFTSEKQIILNRKGQQLIALPESNFRDEIEKNLHSKNINCISEKVGWIAVDWDGEVFPCCFGQHWKSKIVETGLKIDSQKWYKKVLKNNNLNLNELPLDEILEKILDFYKVNGKTVVFKQCLTHCGVNKNIDL